MAKGKGPSTTLVRLTGIERELQRHTRVLTALGEGMVVLERETQAMRREMHDGLGAIVAGLERVHGAIERVAELSGRLMHLEQRVAALEGARGDT